MRRAIAAVGTAVVLAGCGGASPEKRALPAESAPPPVSSDPGAPAPAIPAALGAARQLVVVTTPDWNTVRGELRRYERADASAAWQPVGEAVPIVVGRNGTAWDSALPPVMFAPSKQEGDGRSPAGAFALGGAFGLAAPGEAGWLKLPYTQEVATLECVDDPASKYYNQLVDRAKVPAADWKSSEKMAQVGEAYRWGVVVEYNTHRAAAAGADEHAGHGTQGAAPAGGVVPGRGSCIFLHIGGEDGKGTAGCTAMAAPDLDAVMRWLDPAKAPALVQLPSDAMARLRAPWKLPA